MFVYICDLPVLFAVGLALLLAITTFFQPKKFRNQILVLLYLNAGFLEFMLYLIGSGNILNYPHLFFLELPAFFFIGPLMFFYVLSLMDEKESWRKIDILHFIPAVLTIIYTLPLVLQKVDSKRLFINQLYSGKLELDKNIIPVLGIIYIGLYTVIMLIKILPSIKRKNKNQQLMIIFLSFFLLLVVNLLIGFLGIIIGSFLIKRVIIHLIALLIFAQFIVAERYPYLVRFTTIPKKKKEYSKSHLEGVDIETLKGQLTYLMEEEKLFCDEDLTLSRLSQALENTPHQLSQFINEHYHKNFNTYINSYRIKEAKKLLLKDPQRNTLSIAYSTGFNSYSTFFNAFKKGEGVSPAEFRKMHLALAREKKTLP